MVLIVDDILMLPKTIGGVILNSLYQTVIKLSWAEYQTQLRKTLVRARYDLDNGKLSQQRFKEIESHIFREMRIARKMVDSKEG